MVTNFQSLEKAHSTKKIIFLIRQNEKLAQRKTVNMYCAKNNVWLHM
jgi:hypothetical protein